VVLFIDLVLIKPQVYRHLLFNRLGRKDDKLDGSIKRLGVLLLLFDVYLTWARIEKEIPPSILNDKDGGGILVQPIVVQYLFFRKLAPRSEWGRGVGMLTESQFCFALPSLYCFILRFEFFLLTYLVSDAQTLFRPRFWSRLVRSCFRS
jgi:hypothetical protein